MTVTILVPVYGVEKYIKECAESLFRQTYKDIRYIFCDDCTPDRSLEILNEVVDRCPSRKGDVTVIRNERNLGSGGCRAKLLENLNTECFMFVDSDDILPPNAVEKLVDKMESCRADVISGAYAKYRRGNIDDIVRPEKCGDNRFRKLTYTRATDESHVWGKLYKTSILKETGELFFNGINSAEDLCASTIICSVSHRDFIDDVVYYYRLEGDSTFNRQKSETNIISYVKANRKILEYFQVKGSLSFPIELGLIHCYRFCRRHGFDISRTDELLGYVPVHLVPKTLYSLMRSRSGTAYRIGLLSFVIVRKAVTL